MKVKCNHRSKFSHLSNWKEEAWKTQGFNVGISDSRKYVCVRRLLAYGSSFVFVQSKRRLLHKRFTCRKCLCYVIQRQTTFSLHNNPSSQRNCKLLCHNNWAGDYTWSNDDRTSPWKWHEMNTTIVMDTFDWRPPKLSFWNGKKNRWRAHVTGNRCKTEPRYWFPDSLYLIPWFPGSLIPWFPGSLVLWFPGSLVPWFPGSLVPWFPLQGLTPSGLFMGLLAL